MWNFYTPTVDIEHVGRIGFLVSFAKRLLDSGMHATTISMIGFEVSHNWLRGNKNSFERAVNAIELLAEVEGLRYDVVTCVNQKNFDELDSLKKLLLSKGLKEWRLFTIFPIGRAKQHDALQLDPLQFKKFFDWLAAEKKKGDIEIGYGCEGFLGSYEGRVRDNLFFCRAGVSVASVLADGSISACPNLRFNFIQVNIYEDSFRDVWQNRFQKLRNREWMRNGACSDCQDFKYCDGNGLHLRNENGDLMFCHYNRIKEGEQICTKP